MNPAAEIRSQLQADLTTLSRAFQYSALSDSSLTTADRRKRDEFKDCTFDVLFKDESDHEPEAQIAAFEDG